MKNLSRNKLVQALAKVRIRISYLSTMAGRVDKENTRETIVNPILSALGWDLGDPSSVLLDSDSARLKDGADYVLLHESKPYASIAVLPLGAQIDDSLLPTSGQKAQLTEHGMKWYYVTNGDDNLLLDLSEADEENARMKISLRRQRDRDSLLSFFEPLINPEKNTGDPLTGTVLSSDDIEGAPLKPIEQWIIDALVDMGGRASKSDVEEWIRTNKKERLTERDFEPQDHRGTRSRLLYRAEWAVTRLRNRGLLKGARIPCLWELKEQFSCSGEE